MNLVTLILETLKSLFSLAEKAVPPDKIREDRFEIKKPRLEQEEKNAIFDRQFMRLRNRTEIPIKTHIAFVLDHLDPEDQKELTELLMARIIAYRKKRPVKFRKWLKENNLN